MTHITTIKINSKASCNLLQTRHSFTPWFVKNAKQTCTFFVPCLVFCLCWVVFLTQKLHLSVHLKHCRTGCPLKRQSQQQSCFTNCMCQDTLERKSFVFLALSCDIGSCVELKVLRTLRKHWLISFVYVIKINTQYKCNSMWQTEKAVHVSAAIKRLAGKEWGKWQQVCSNGKIQHDEYLAEFQ